MGFTKLDEGLVYSSIMGEDDSVFRVWVVLLATCRENGVSPVTPIFLSRVTFKPIEEIERCLGVLESPDKYSRTTDEDGRRIKRVNGGYEIINYHRYREKNLTEYWKEKKRNQRKNQECPGHSGTVLENLGLSASSVLKESSNSSLSLKKKTSISSGRPKKTVVDELPDIPGHLWEVWPGFMEVRKSKGAVNSPRALRSILKELNKLSSDPATQVRIVEQSIRASWKDVYQIKEVSGGGKPTRQLYEFEKGAAEKYNNLPETRIGDSS